MISRSLLILVTKSKHAPKMSMVSGSILTIITKLVNRLAIILTWYLGHLCCFLISCCITTLILVSCGFLSGIDVCIGHMSVILAFARSVGICQQSFPNVCCVSVMVMDQCFLSVYWVLHVSNTYCLFPFTFSEILFILIIIRLLL